MKKNNIIDWQQYFEEQNIWLLEKAKDIKGDILSIGSGNDKDMEGGRYREYFKSKNSYTTSDVTLKYKADIKLDVRDMSSISDNRYDAIFCNNVIEHIDDIYTAILEMTRILKPNGKLLINFILIGPPHCMPLDFWRFTIPAIKYLLTDKYEIEDIKEIGSVTLTTDFVDGIADFPVAYWAIARKL